MGMRFFYRGLLFWNPVFETKIDLYKFIRIFLFIIRGTVFIFLITLEIITYEEIGKKPIRSRRTANDDRRNFNC